MRSSSDFKRKHLELETSKEANQVSGISSIPSSHFSNDFVGFE
jgi:hypothetical protein